MTIRGFVTLKKDICRLAPSKMRSGGLEPLIPAVECHCLGSSPIPRRHATCLEVNYSGEDRGVDLHPGRLESFRLT